MELLVKKLSPTAKLPTRANHDDAGLDLYTNETLTIKPGERVAVSTGLAFAVPSGFVGLIWDKGSVSFKIGLTCLAGVLDAQYRGELKVVILNVHSESVTIEVGQKIAQLLIQKVELPTVVETTDLTETDRGSGGFGSTGLF